MASPIAIATLRTSIVLGLRLIMQAGSLVILARVLGPSAFGAYTALGALAVLLGTLTTFGTHLVLLRDVSRSPSARGIVLQRVLGTSAICGVVLFFSYVILCVFWLKLDVALATIVSVGIAEILLQPVFVIAAAERLAFGEVARSQMLLNSPLFLRVLVAATVSMWGAQYPLAAFVVGYLCLMAVALFLTLLKASPAWPAPWRWQIMGLLGWKDASGYAFQGASAAGASEMDKMLAGKWLPADAGGIYAAASRVVMASVLPITALVLAAMPRLLRRSMPGIQQVRRRMFTVAVLYGVFAGGGLWLCSTWLSPLFGKNYTGFEYIVEILALAVPAISIRTVAMNELITCDLPWVRVSLDLAGWLFLCMMAWLLIPNMGGAGLAWAVTCTEWILAAASSVAAWKSTR